MSKVASRILGFHLDQASRGGKTTGWLFEGLESRIDPAHLPDWITWEDFCTLTARITDLIGLDAVEEAGANIVDVVETTFITRVLSAGISAKTVYWGSQKWGGPLSFPSIKTGYEELADGRLLLTLTIPAGDRDCVAFFRLNAGFNRALPRVIGLPDAIVDLQLSPRHGRYFIQPPPAVTLRHRLSRAMKLLVNPSSDPSLPAFRQLADQHVEVQRRYHDAMVARDQAREATRTAERALAIKSEFLATMSHELRTPLNGIIAAASLLQADPLEPYQHKKVEVIMRSGKRLLEQINELLDLAKVDIGTIALREESVDLRQLIEDVEQVFAPRAKRKDLNFEVSLTHLPDWPVSADGQRLRQVLFNFLDNAVKFTKQGGIKLEVHGDVPDHGGDTEACRLRFSVTDSGIGLDSDASEWLFNPFSQAERSYTRQQEGAGLGLSICRRLVELMDGELGYDSTLGEGARFWFEVSFERASAEAIQAAESQRALSDVSPGSTGRPSRPISALSSTPAEDWLSVLVVEDNEINQLVTCAMLRRLHCRVELVGDGLQAVEAVARSHYDIVLMDCRMPNMNGYDATRAIRQLGGTTSKTPIVALTAHTLPEDHLRCMEAGMNGVVGKPATLDQLRSALVEYSTMAQAAPSPAAAPVP